MKKKNLGLTILSLVMLAGCGGTASTSSAPVSSDTPISSQAETSDSVKTSDTSSEVQIPEIEGEDKTPVDKSDYPYLASLDSYKKTDWHKNCRWIWGSVTDQDVYQAFRKSFTLDKAPSEAICSIAVENNYYLWVNGTMVIYDGGCNRGPSPVDSYYDQIDLAQYLQAGENNITVLVEYIGRNGNAMVSAEEGGMLFELKMGDQYICSNQTWKTKRLLEYKNKKLLRNSWPKDTASFLAEFNLYYDNRDNSGEYWKNDYDDSSWEDAKNVHTVGAQPFNDTYLCVNPPLAFDKEYSYCTDTDSVLGTKFTEETEVTFSLPENMQFSLYLDLDSENEGQIITYHTDTYAPAGDQTFEDHYVTSSGHQTFEAYPWRSGQAVVLTVPAGVTLNQVGYRRSQYDSNVDGQFVCEDSDLNTLWTKAANTLKICMRDAYMDCPERERSPYAGDGVNEIYQSFYALDLNGQVSMNKKMVLATIGWTTADHIFPTRSPSAASTKEIPVQNLAYLTAVNEYFKRTGDVETAKLFYPVARDYLLDVFTFNDGIMDKRSGTWSWFDWGTEYDSKLIYLDWYYYAAKCVKEMGELIEDTSDAASLTQRMDWCKAEFATYKVGNAYKSVDDYDDRANALAVVSGIVGEDDYEGIYNVLTTREQASPYMEKYCLEALCMMGQYNYAKTRMVSRYKGMIDDDYTTLWELWERDEGTVNHGWTGGPLTVMSNYFAGIKCTSKAYETYEVCPQDMFDSLTSNTVTVKGDINVQITNTTDSASIVVKTIDAEGIIRIPMSFGLNVAVSGGAYEDLGIQGSDYCYKITTAGTYTFTID